MHGLYLGDKFVRGIQTLLIMQQERGSHFALTIDCCYCIRDQQIHQRNWGQKKEEKKKKEPVSWGLVSFSFVYQIPTWANNPNSGAKPGSIKLDILWIICLVISRLLTFSHIMTQDIKSPHLNSIMLFWFYLLNTPD